MEKIKIISTARILKPKALDSIDISYGVSYVAQDYSVKTLDDKSSWQIKALGRINDFIQFFSKKNQESSDKEIIEQIIENSDFLYQHQNEYIKNLQVQLNQENPVTKSVKFFSKFITNKKDTIENSLNMNVASFRQSYENKIILLGLNNFKKGGFFYDNLSPELNRKEIASFIFFHEYSHSIEIENYANFYKPVQNESFDRFYANLCKLSIQENYEEVEKLIKDKKDFSMPYSFFIKNLRMLHMEMYADTNALLLMRNKAVIDGDFKEENIEKIINAVIKVRKSEQLVNKKNVEEITEHSPYTFPFNDHFTSPAIESLSYHLNQVLIDQPKDKILTDKEMHEIVIKCVEEGMAKTLLLIRKAVYSIDSDLNTILSLRTKNGQFMIDENNNIDDAMVKINAIVPDSWKNKFEQNLNQPFEKTPSIIFDAAMNYEEFEKSRQNYESIKAINELFKQNMQPILLDPIKKEIETNILQDNSLIGVKTEKNTLGKTENDSHNINSNENFLPINKEAIKKNIASMRNKVNVIQHNTLKLK